MLHLLVENFGHLANLLEKFLDLQIEMTISILRVVDNVSLGMMCGTRQKSAVLNYFL